MATEGTSVNRFEDGHAPVICEDATHHPDFPHHAFITYWVIASYAAGAGKANVGECRVGQTVLAERAGIPARTLRDHLAALVAAGFIHIKRTGRTSVYTVTGNRCRSRIPIGGQPAPRTSRTRTRLAHELAEQTADCSEYNGLNRDRNSAITRQAVATLSAEGASDDDIRAAVDGYTDGGSVQYDEYGKAPSASELREHLPTRPAAPAAPAPSPAAADVEPQGCVHRRGLAWCGGCLANRGARRRVV